MNAIRRCYCCRCRFIDYDDDNVNAIFVPAATVVVAIIVISTVSCSRLVLS